MEWIVINIKTGKQELEWTFHSKSIAEQNIVDIILGANIRKQSLKYYQTLGVKEIDTRR